MRLQFSALLLAALVLFSLGCEAAPALGAACTRASECASPLVCTFGRCRAECAETRDCPIATRCFFASPAAGVCSLDVENHCDTNVCPAPLLCVDDQCRTECIDDDDCLAGACVRLTCVEPISGVDAGPPLDAPLDAGVDAPSQQDGGLDVCVPASASSLSALLGAASISGRGLRASSTAVTEVGGSLPPVLAAAAFVDSAGAAAVYIATSDGSPHLFASPLDPPLAFSPFALFAGVTDVWSVDLSSDGTDLLAVLERQPSGPADEFAWAHDGPPAPSMEGLVPGGAGPVRFYGGGAAIVGGVSPFGGARAAIFYVFHEGTGADSAIGAVDEGRGPGSRRAVDPLASMTFENGVIELASSHGPLVLLRDPVSTLVGYWRPDDDAGAAIVELRTATTALPGLASALDGTHSIIAWADGMGVSVSRILCGGMGCERPVERGRVAEGAVRVSAVAIVAVAQGYVLGVGREDGTVEVHLVDDSGTLADAAPFADVSTFSPPASLGATGPVRALSMTATPTPSGAAVVLAVLGQGEMQGVWTASYVVCTL